MYCIKCRVSLPSWAGLASDKPICKACRLQPPSPSQSANAAVTTGPNAQASGSSNLKRKRVEVYVEVPVYANTDAHEPALLSKKWKGKAKAQDSGVGEHTTASSSKSTKTTSFQATAPTPLSGSVPVASKAVPITPPTKICDNCKIDLRATVCWKGRNGERSCNDCGLYQAEHHRPRPIYHCASCTAKVSKTWWDVGLGNGRIYCNSCKEFLVQDSDRVKQLTPETLPIMGSSGPVCADCQSEETRLWWGFVDREARYCENCASVKLKQMVKGLVACVPDRDVRPVHSRPSTSRSVNRPSVSPEKTRAGHSSVASVTKGVVQPATPTTSIDRPVSPTKRAPDAASPNKAITSAAPGPTALARSLSLGEWSPHKPSRSYLLSNGSPIKEAVSAAQKVQPKGTSRPSTSIRPSASNAATSSTNTSIAKRMPAFPMFSNAVDQATKQRHESSSSVNVATSPFQLPSISLGGKTASSKASDPLRRNSMPTASSSKLVRASAVAPPVKTKTNSGRDKLGDSASSTTALRQPIGLPLAAASVPRVRKPAEAKPSNKEPRNAIEIPQVSLEYAAALGSAGRSSTSVVPAKSHLAEDSSTSPTPVKSPSSSTSTAFGPTAKADGTIYPTGASSKAGPVAQALATSSARSFYATSSSKSKSNGDRSSSKAATVNGSPSPTPTKPAPSLDTLTRDRGLTTSTKPNLSPAAAIAPSSATERRPGKTKPKVRYECDFDGCGVYYVKLAGLKIHQDRVRH